MRNAISPLLALLPLFASNQARAEDYLRHRPEIINVDPKVADDRSNAPYRTLLERLRAGTRRDAEAAGVPSFNTVVPFGPRAEHMLVAAITPDRGHFVLVPSLRSFLSAANDRSQQGQMKLCRFSIEWSSLPGGAYAPGLSWTSWAFPTKDCQAPTPDHVKTIQFWRSKASGAAYKREFSRNLAGLRAGLISEKWVGQQPTQTADAASVLKAWLSNKDNVRLAIPLPDTFEPMAFVETGEGRTFLLRFERLSRNSCVVEGLSWRDVAEGIYGKRMLPAGELCEALFEEHRKKRFEQLERDAKRSPPVIRPLPN